MGGAENRFERSPRLTLVSLWLGSALIVGLAFEACFRFQVVDFYRPDLRKANSVQALEPSHRPRRTLLMMGDSFTAWPGSYPAILSNRLGVDARVVNSGVSGFTLRQIARILPGRLAEFEPETVVLQLFAGNDLVELQHPVAWTRVSPVRNLFWIASDSWFESVGFINYRLGSIEIR